MTDTNGTFDLAHAFHLQQQKLRSDLNVGDIATHPGTKGDDGELNWAGMLKKLLPNRYAVAKAFVVDVNGQQSEQIDVVIYDRHFSPLLFEVGGAIYIPSESVYAVLEVKQTLDKANIEYAAKKVASVRRLHRTSAPVPYVAGLYEPKDPHAVIGGLLTRRSGWNPPFGPAFAACLESQEQLRQLDLGCALDDGAFWLCTEEGSGMPEHSAPDISLITFVMKLLQRLQAMGSAPAIDYGAYLESILGSREERGAI